MRLKGESMNKIHSVVDVITNSSTEIYTNIGSSAEKVVRSLLTSLLKATAVPETVDDCFEIEIDQENSTILVTSKRTKEVIDLRDAFSSMFDQSASYNG